MESRAIQAINVLKVKLTKDAGVELGTDLCVQFQSATSVSATVGNARLILKAGVM